MPFVGLDGIKQKEIEGTFVGSAAAAIRALKEHRVASLAGDRGAVTVWRDDEGNLRGDFSRYHITRDSILAKSRTELSAWLKRTVPKCK